MNRIVVIVVVLSLSGLAWGQQPEFEFSNNGASNAPTSLRGEDYRIGPDDAIDISVFGLANYNSSVRVTAGGKVSYSPVGEVAALGLTQQELARTIEERLKSTGVRNPRVQILVREYASQPVSIVGAVKNPNIYQIKGQKTLIDMLAMAGDRSETAGSKIQVIRGDRTIIVDMVDLYQSANALLNIPIYAGDRIIVLEAQYVTVVGEVQNQGQFPLKYGKNLSVLEAWALGGGPTPNARKKETVILREHQNGTIEEIAVNMDNLLDRKIEDVGLLPGDVLYVPASPVRGSVRRVMDSLISVGIGRAIYVR